MVTDEELNRKIAALKQSFIAGLAARFDEMDAAVADISAGQPLADQAASIKIILEHAHKLAGSAGTFGLAKMSSIAQSAEQLCDRILKNIHGSDEEALRDLRGKLADIRAEAAQ